jgi:hypothetical protein
MKQPGTQDTEQYLSSFKKWPDADVAELAETISQNNPDNQIKEPHDYPSQWRIPFLRGALESYFRKIYTNVLNKSDKVKLPEKSPLPQ